MHLLLPQLSSDLPSSPHEQTCTSTAATLQHHYCPFLSHPHLPSLLPTSTTRRSRGSRERRRSITIFIANYQLIGGATLPYQPASAALQKEEAQQDPQAFQVHLPILPRLHPSLQVPPVPRRPCPGWHPHDGYPLRPPQGPYQFGHPGQPTMPTSPPIRAVPTHQQATPRHGIWSRKDCSGVREEG